MCKSIGNRALLLPLDIVLWQNGLCDDLLSHYMRVRFLPALLMGSCCNGSMTGCVPVGVGSNPTDPSNTILIPSLMAERLAVNQGGLSSSLRESAICWNKIMVVTQIPNLWVRVQILLPVQYCILLVL